MDTIGQANELLRGLGFSNKEARVEPCDDVAILRGSLVGQHVDAAGNLYRFIRELPTRGFLVELKRRAADHDARRGAPGPSSRRPYPMLTVRR